MACRVRIRLFKPVLKEHKQFKRLTSSQSPKLSYHHTPTTDPLQYRTVGQIISSATDKWPDNEVVVSVPSQTRLTFSQSNQQATHLAAGLLGLGLEPGDRIAIFSPNSPQWYITALAAAKAGFIVVPMNPAYTATELQYCLQKVKARALVTDETFRTPNYYQILSQIFPQLPNLPTNSSLKPTNQQHLEFIIANSEKHLPGTFRFRDVLEGFGSMEKLHQAENKVQPENVHIIQFTSGTSGNPKAVPMTHFAVVNNTSEQGPKFGVDKKIHTMLTQAPFFHVLGYLGTLTASLVFGAKLILPSAIFNVKESCHAIKDEKCTYLIGTPTMYVDICSHVNSLPAEERLLYQSPEAALCSGALFMADLFTTIKETFGITTILTAYGMTETAGAGYQTSEHDTDFIASSTVGKLQRNVEAKVVDVEGRTLPLGQVGELWIRSPTNTPGYWDDPKATANLYAENGWLRTGDSFIMLEDGYGQIVGRTKDIIIRGGENISPRDIEEVLTTHPDILEACVFGISSERLGEEVGCSLRVKPGSHLTEQQIRDFCKDKIAHFKIPRYAEFVDEYPKTGSGKVQKYKLRAAMEKKLLIVK